MLGKTVHMVLGINPSGGKTANGYMVFVFHVPACCFLFYRTINTMLYAVYPLLLYQTTRQAFPMFEYSGLSCVFSMVPRETYKGNNSSR